jgi:hypothetical protein
MKKFIVERILPGAGNLTAEELQLMSSISCEVILQMGRPYHCIQSYITDDKIYSIYIAESDKVVREHSKLAKLPVNHISEVKTIIDALTGNPM